MDDFKPDYQFQQTRIDSMYVGRLLMKQECIRILKTVNQTKAVARAIELIERIEVNPSANDSIR